MGMRISHTLNYHGVKSFRLEQDSHQGSSWLNLTLVGEEGREQTITFFDRTEQDMYNAAEQAMNK